MKTTLVTVVSGEIYEKMAEDLFRSADEHFHPTDEVEFLMLTGRQGWPNATMYRHHVLFRYLPKSDYVFLSDADMLFMAPVGPEILPPAWVTATLHPGYVSRHPSQYPYERRVESAAYIAGGDHYYCGGFVGGTRVGMAILGLNIAAVIDLDQKNGITPIWHDESALNHVLAAQPPEVTLDPSYCYPDDDRYYKTFWTENYERKLVALDKTEEQLSARG